MVIYPVFGCILMCEQSRENYVASASVRRGRVRLFGRGLDNAGGHFHYTTSEGVELIGGSDSVHAEMQRRALIIQSQLDDLGISMESMTYEQYLVAKDIVAKVNAE